MEKEYIVSINRGEDLAQIEAELTASTGEGPIPNRSVDIANARPASKRQTHFMLTDEEATALREDSRISGVDQPLEQDSMISIGHRAVQTGDFTQTTSDTGTYINWGLRRCNEATNVYGTGSTVSGGYNYILDGTGVDIVIQDTGIQADHPEWEDADGNTRFVPLDWYAASGVSGALPAGFYTDYHGHGTHVGGTSAGKTYGWAKNAAIYAQKLAGLEGTFDPNNGMSFADCVDTLIGWHNAKTNGRPTIVNMSWGSSYLYTGVDSVNYRGAGYGFTDESYFYQIYGVGPWRGSGGNYGGGYVYVPARVNSVDTGIQELIDAGIHVCIAAGNDYNKIDVVGGVDYNNYVTGRITSGGTNYNAQSVYYHRGSSPFDDEAFCIGSVDSTDQGGLDRKSAFSSHGPGVNIYAPGSNIMSSSSQVNQIGGSTYYANSSYKQTNISGTSMSCPQVTGLGALYLQLNKNWTPAQLKAALEVDSKGVLYDNPSATYDVTNALQGGPNRMMYNKFGVAQDGRSKNGMIVRNAAVNLRK